MPREDGILFRIRDWFNDAGFEQRAFVVGEGNLFGVGATQFRGAPAQLQPGVRLFGEFLR